MLDLNLLHKQAYHFDLPPELIAQYPLPERSNSRLLVVNRTEKTLAHRHFTNVVDYLNSDDVLVINTTKVIPARLFGEKETGGKVEILLVRHQESVFDVRESGFGEQAISQAMKDLKASSQPIKPNTEHRTPNTVTYQCLIKPAKKVKTGHKIIISDMVAEVIAYNPDGTRLVRFHYDGDFMEILQRIGEVPLPPYISRKAERNDKETYQTVYATHQGSVAAPTAGLHFTNDLLQKIKDKGIHIAEVVLNVGLGTFRPVEADIITDHQMHSEYCEISPETAEIINNANSNGKKIVAVGTTSARTLESFMQVSAPTPLTRGTVSVSPVQARESKIAHGKKWTDLFLYPGKDFHIVDALITNFHTPQSTLLMLVSAFAGYELIMDAYREAIQQKYRFYSYGDAMLII